MIRICISVTSHAIDPLPLSQTVTPSRTTSPLERDVLYGRPHFTQHVNHCALYTDSDAPTKGKTRKATITQNHCLDATTNTANENHTWSLGNLLEPGKLNSFLLLHRKWQQEMEERMMRQLQDLRGFSRPDRNRDQRLDVQIPITCYNCGLVGHIAR